MANERLYDRNFACAFLSQVGFVLANTAIVAHYPRWIGDVLGGEVDVVGRITALAAIAGLLLRPWIGQWIDRFGARAVWFGGYAVFAAGAAANLWLDGLGLGVYLCRALLVVGAAISFSCSLTYVTLLAPPKRRAEAIGTLGIAGFIGIIFGPFTTELLLTDQRGREEFESIFLVCVAMLVLPSILLSLLRPMTAESRNQSLKLVDFVRTCRRYWPGTIMLVQTVFGLSMTVPFVFLTRFVDDTGLQGTGFSRASLFFICYATWGLTLRLALRKVPELLGRRKMLLAGAIVMALGMLSFLLVDAENSWRIVIPALLCGTGHSLMYHTCTALFLESFPTEVRGAGSALSMVAMDVGMIVGSQALGMVAATQGYDMLFLTVGVLVASAGMVYAIVSIPVWQERWRAARSSA